MKIAIAGLGNMGGKILDPIYGSDLVHAVVGFDPDPGVRCRVRQSHDIELVDSYEHLLDDSEVRLVFVTSPNHTHEVAAIEALEAGKAVMCEKPMANTLEGAQRMVQTAERLGGYLQIGFEARYSCLYKWAHERIAQGLIGQVVNTQCNYICSEFIGKRSWRSTLSGTGGMFGEKLCHYVDLPRWWIDSPVTEVISLCAPNVVPYYEIRDNYHTTCRYENGAVSHLTFMMAVAPTVKKQDPLDNHMTLNSDNGHELRYLIQGTKGAIETDVFHRRFRRWQFTDGPKGLMSAIVEDLTWDPDKDHDFVHNVTDQAVDVIGRVANDKKPYTGPSDSLETMRVVFAAEKSADTGEIVTLDKIASVSSR